MKQYKTTIISLIIIVAALAAFFIISSILGDKETAGTPEASPTPYEETSEQLFDIESTLDVARYECNINDNIVLERVNGEWACTSYDNLTLEGVNVASSVNLVIKSMAVAVYEGDITKEILDTYEISDTEYVKIGLKNGKMYTVRFGMQKPGTVSYFMIVEENKKVYLVTDMYKSNLIITKDKLIHTKIFDFADSGKIRKIEIQKSGKDFLTVNADGVGENRKWNVLYPIERAGNTSHIEDIISSVEAIYTDKYIEGDCEDLAKYGLDVPYFVIYITDNNGTQTLMLGSKEPEGKAYYCMFGNTKNVFTIETSSVTFVDDDVIKYIDTYIFNRMYTELELITIKITCGDINETFTLGFDIQGDDEQLYFNGAPLPHDDMDIIRPFRRINTAVYSLDLVGLEDEPGAKGELLVSVEYKMSSGEIAVVEGYRRDETTMYLYLNGEYAGGYEYIRQITADNLSYGIIGTIENFKSISGMN